MSINPEQLVALIASAGRLVGVKELLRAGGYHPGEQTELKRALRELVRQGRVERDGKRFGVPGEKPTQKSGPAWGGKQAGVAKKPAPPGGREPEPPRHGRGAPERGQAERARALLAAARPSPKDEAVGEAAQGERSRSSREPGRPSTPLGVRGPGATGADRPAEQRRPAHGERRQPQRAPKGPTVEGFISHHRDGFAFVKPLMGKGEDIFIPPDEARRALDNDRVVVEVQKERDGRFSGRIVEVRARTRQLVVGTYREKGDRAWVEPREAELGHVRVPKTQLARPGDAVKVRLGVGTGLFGHADALVGEVAGSLGSPDDHSVEVLSVAFAKGFHDEFPPEVMDEADGFELAVSEAEATGGGRRDLREMGLVTIDGEDARDFDDAIFVADHQHGWRLVVAIADVSHYVREGSALDTEGLRRATSVYLPGRVLPMLPERLSNGICSLKPDEDRLCMVADMVVDAQGRTRSSEVYPGVMRSAARCTYTEVHQVLAGESVPRRDHLKAHFQRADALAKALTAMRKERGAIDFDLPETRVELDEQGQPKRMVLRERWESHRLVEECMLAANEAVARFFRERNLPTVNRFHAQPDEDKLATFVGLLRAYGVAAPTDELTSKELNAILTGLEGHPEQRALHQLALRSMMQAVYSSANTGHYGLGAEDYLHFTSPIRRYPDLLVHRLLKQFWANDRRNLEEEEERLELLAVQSSERERAAMQVEREVVALYACLMMRDRVGQTFPATVSGLSENGFYVRLDELHVEGLVKGETVFPQFRLDAQTYRLRFGDGRVVKVGQKLEVRLLGVNLGRKQMDYGVETFIDELIETAEERLRGGKPQGGGKQGRRREHPEERGRRVGGRHQGRGRADREEPSPRRSPPVRAQPAREQPPQAGQGGGFSARAVLDRLWQERGGAPSKPPDEHHQKSDQHAGRSKHAKHQKNHKR